MSANTTTRTIDKSRRITKKPITIIKMTTVKQWWTQTKICPKMKGAVVSTIMWVFEITSPPNDEATNCDHSLIFVFVVQCLVSIEKH